MGARIERLDARRRLMAVQSQEILTKDNIQVRLSAIVTFHVTDPARAVHESESYEQELYVATQLALRAAVADVEIRDVILPGDVRQAFAEVLRARADGRAALERARGESAALRNLANGARVLQDNPGLMNLRILQAIGQEQAVPGTTRFVVNLPDPAPPPPAGPPANQQ